MPRVSINHVSLSVVDMEESLRFYTEFLGMERIPGPQFGFRVEWLRVGDLELHLFERETEAPLYHHVGFTVPNFEELYVRAKEMDILVHMPPFAQVTELPDGGAQMYVRDPGGNLIELDTPDASVLDPSVVEMRRLVDAIPQSEYNCRATLFLEPWDRRLMAAADERTSPGKAAQVAADRLRDLIRCGDLGPGDRLPVERVLAVQLGVSRSTLREGIRSLRSTGLLHARQGSGTYVTDLEPATLASPLVFALARSGGQIPRVFEVRAMLEVGGAELAAEHATPRDIEALHRLNDRIARTGGPAAMLIADWKFHHHIHQMSRNELLVLLLDSIAELGKGVRRAGIARDEIRIRSAEQHVAIIEAIAAGEPAAAGAAMRQHLDYVRRVLQALEEEEAATSGGDEPDGQAPGLA